MKSLTTSNFRLAGKHPGAVSIANTSRWYRVQRYLPLVPPWAWVKASRESRMSASEFYGRYRLQLQGLDPHQVVEDLERLVDGPEIVMLCWEAPGEYCHRRIAATWLESELGIVVPEREVEEPRRKR